MGNFYADLVKVTTRVLIPLSIIGGMLLIWQGVPQNFDPNVTVTTIEGTQQDIAMGPVAALEIIKHIGTNGGGFLGANSSTPIGEPHHHQRSGGALLHDDPARRLRDHVRQDGQRPPP